MFFPPHNLPPQGPPTGSFIDGGVFANNPSTVAVAAYLGSTLVQSTPLAPDDLAAVSIGTGDVSNSYPPSNAIFPFGILGWMWPEQDGTSPAFPLIQAMFAGTSKIDELTAAALLRGHTYIRANPTFKETWSLDDCSAITAIGSLTDQYITTGDWQKKAGEINQLAAG